MKQQLLTIARKAATTAAQVAIPLLLVNGIANIGPDVAQTAGIAALAAAVTVVLNSVRALRVQGLWPRVARTAVEAGLAVVAAAGLNVWSVSVADTALTAALLAAVTAFAAGVQDTITE